MIRSLLLCALLTILISSVMAPSRAPCATAAGLDLAWNACAVDGGASDVTFACTDPERYYDLVGSFVTDAAFPRFRRAMIVLDLQVDSAVLPDFFNFAALSNLAGCNAGILIHKVWKSNACATTVTPWVHPPWVCTFELPTLEFAAGIGGPNRGRLTSNIKECQADGVPIEADRPYYLFTIQLYTALTASCSGCQTPAAIVFNQMTLYSFDDQVAPRTITGPGLVSNCVTVNGGGAVSCGATPARRNTWGALKALYR